MSGARDLEPLVIDLINRDALKVPLHPPVAMRLQKVVTSGKYGAADLAKLVGEDQALAATLLRYANSPKYRGIEQITSLHDAITRMGAAEVCRSAFALSFASHATAPGPLVGLRRHWWYQALLSAHVCYQLGDLRGLRRDKAFVCGLLHDFGRAVTLAAFEQILEEKEDARVLPAHLWEASVDRVHVEAGVTLAQRWNLSTLVRAAMALHHRPEDAGVHRKMLEVVAASDGIVAGVDGHAHITSRDMAPVPSLRPDEIVVLTDLVPQLAAAVAELDAVNAVEIARAPSRSQVQKPRTALEGDAKLFRFDIQMPRPGGSLQFRGGYISPEGLGFSGNVRLAENSIVRLSIEPEGMKPLGVFARVLLCVTEGDAHRIEAQLFGLDRPSLAAWNALYQSIN
ncbi:MAG TPA: HDOD domain-containing protein [Polyangia bacterium]|nr:HDOD domain-containing protein [Polyangia bacterium]